MKGVVEYYEQRVTDQGRDRSVSVHSSLDEGNPSSKRERYQQMIRAKLAELRTPEFDWKKVPENQRTWARRYYLTLLRDRRDRCLVISQRPTIPWGTAEGVRDLLFELRFEIFILKNQDGVAGLGDRLVFDVAFEELDPLVNDLAKKLEANRGYKLDDDDWARIRTFFEYRESF